jgi:hypothetical protein
MLGNGGPRRRQTGVYGTVGLHTALGDESLDNAAVSETMFETGTHREFDAFAFPVSGLVATDGRRPSD